MPEIRPFAGIRYQATAVKDLSRVVAPPYDVIDTAHHARLLSQDPRNCVRLDLGETPGKPGSYEDGAALLARWMKEGVMAQDGAPSYYLVEDTFTLAGGKEPYRRWGVIGRVRLEPLDTGRIHPHERTHKGPKEDRMRHMRAYRGNLSQIFALFDGDARPVKDALKGTFASKPAADFVDPEGVGRRLWVISDPALVRKLTSLLSDRDYYIADGHHRYETALAYGQQMASADPSPDPSRGYNFVMMALVGMEDPGLAILPTHRLLKDFPSFTFDALRKRLEGSFEIEEAAPSVTSAIRDGQTPPRLERRGFFLYDPAADRILRALVRKGLSLAEAVPDLPAPVRELEVTLAERLVMIGCLGMTPDQISHQEHLEYFKDLKEALARTRSAGQVLVILPPTDLKDLVAVTRARERMPQKSTFFYPKLLTGLVFYSHADPTR